MPDDRAETLLRLYRVPRRSRDWGRAHALAIELATVAPDAIVPFALACIQEGLDIGPDLAALISFLGAEQWPVLVEAAVAALRENSENRAADDLLDQACLRVPIAAHPYLETIYDLPPAYRYMDAFHETHWHEVDFLARRLLKAPSEHRRPIAATLVETRLPTAFALAKKYDPRYPAYLAQVGFADTPEEVRQLYVELPQHVAFEPNYLTALIGTYDRWRALSPTWKASAPDAACYRLGGKTAARCHSCGGILHHLVTFDPVPDGIGITKLARLELATCLSCLGWEHEYLAYEHDAYGVPRDLSHAEELRVPEFPAPALRETEISLVDLGPLWRWQESGASNHRENLFRVGGHPSWIQHAEYPACARCGVPSHFLLQLDSDLPTQEEPPAAGWNWGESGICYIFWCNACSVSTLFWQCT
jgi:hypothetical protein